MACKHWKSILIAFIFVFLFIIYFDQLFGQSYIVDIRNTGSSIVVLKKASIDGRTYLNKDVKLKPTRLGALQGGGDRTYPIEFHSRTIHLLEFIVEDKNQIIKYSCELIDENGVGGAFFIDFSDGKPLTSPWYCQSLADFY